MDIKIETIDWTVIDWAKLVNELIIKMDLPLNENRNTEYK